MAITVKVEIPQSFHWVISRMVQWSKEQKTGKFVLNYKDGGICGIEKSEYEKPPPKE